MPGRTHTELVFEDHIAERLVAGGYRQRQPGDYSREHALDVQVLVEFLRATQPDEWAKLEKAYPSQSAVQALVRRVVAVRSEFGTLHLLRNQLDLIPNIRFWLVGFRPASGLVTALEARYQANILSFVRQLAYSRRNMNELDFGLFVNGIPVATAELKSPASGQTYQHAEEQYRTDRPPAGEPLLAFKAGALVHFAVDTRHVSMTTRLLNGATPFLPFNKGRNGGAGNPDPEPGLFATSYLWEEVWAKDTWLEVLGRFLHLQRTAQRSEDGSEVVREALIFPRWHQLQAVRNLAAHARVHGAGQGYLVQHSAGSGKTNTIAWTAHRLATLHDAADERVFHSVVIVSDRRVLDSQLQETVRQFEATPGFVRAIEGTSRELAAALREGARIVVSTIQKFATSTIQELDALKGQDGKPLRFAVIIDEAHSGQSGEAADALQRTLAGSAGAVVLHGGQDDSVVTAADLVAAAQAARGPQPNISYLAFTATPRNVTLERFGTRDGDGGPHAFHAYSMRQAIEEGFILDVLPNYLTYDAFYRIEKAVEDDPVFEGRRGAQRLAQAVSLHPTNIAQKVEVVVEHFRRSVARRLGGQAKAMVVASSREGAVRWWQAMREYIAARGITGVDALVAFSGSVEVDGQEWTEAAANGFPEAQLPSRFDGPDYQVLLVAEKYQTGFDQPKLVAMYVDRGLAGLQAVQTLSRLNRTYPGKDSVLVVDFRNRAEDIRAAFAPYYEGMLMEGATDPNQVFTLRMRLLGLGYLDPAHVADFAKVLHGPGSDTAKRLRLEALVAPSVERMEADPDEDRRAEFRDLCKSYCRFYAFVSQVWTVGAPDLEELYAYLTWLNRMMPERHGGQRAMVTADMVQLTAMRLKENALQDASLKPGDGEALKPIGEFGAQGWTEEELRTLSDIIEGFNERHGLDLRPEDALVLEQAHEEVLQDEHLRDIIENNPEDIGLREYQRRFQRAAAALFARQDRFGTAFTRDSKVRQELARMFFGRRATSLRLRSPA